MDTACTASESRASGATGTARFVAAAVGFTGAVAWQNTLADSLYLPSTDVAVSPLFAFFAAAAAILSFWPARRRMEQALLSPSKGGFKALFAAGIAIGSVATLLVGAQLLPLWALYLAAALMGISSSVCTYLWAIKLHRFSESQLVPTAFSALGLASLLSLAFMSAPAAIGAVIAAPLFGIVSLVGFFVDAPDSAMPQAGKAPEPQPQRARQGGGRYGRIAAAMTLFAAALGVTAGTTATGATISNMAAINRDTSLAALAVAAVVLVAYVLSKRRLSFLSIVQVFTPFVVLTMLLNVVALEMSDVWLAITLSSWHVLWVIAFGMICVTAWRGMIGLTTVFPAWWAALNCGYALGILFGQAVCPLFVTDEQSLFVVIVCVIMAVVCSIVLLFGSDALHEPVADEEADGEESRTADAKQPAQEEAEHASLAAAAKDGSQAAATAPVANVKGGTSDQAEAPQEEPRRTGEQMDGQTGETAPKTMPKSEPAPTAESAPAASPAAYPEPEQADTPAASPEEPEASLAPQSEAAPEEPQHQSDAPLEALCGDIAQAKGLSARETEVMVLLLHGHTKASIAKKLYISENTVRAHTKGVYSKLDVHSKQELVDYVESFASGEESGHGTDEATPGESA